MIRRLLSRKTRDVPATSALPYEVEVCIETAGVIVRPASERVLVHPRGYTPFVHSLEGAASFMRDAFPGLTNDQVARAVRFLDSHVTKRVALHAQQHEHAEDGSRWSDWRPLTL